jgi:hypothetical protein
MSLKNKQLTRREFIKTLGIFGILFSFGGFLSLFGAKNEPSKSKNGFGSGGYGV